MTKEKNGFQFTFEIHHLVCLTNIYHHADQKLESTNYHDWAAC